MVSGLLEKLEEGRTGGTRLSRWILWKIYINFLSWPLSIVINQDDQWSLIIHYHCQCFADNSRGGPSQKLGGFRSGPTCSWRPLHIRRHRWGESSIKRQKQKPINKHIITNKKKRKGYFWQSKQIKCCMFKQVINQQTMNKWEYPSTSKVMSRDALHKLRWCELASKVIWQNCVKPMIWPKYKHPSSTLYAMHCPK